MNDAPKTPSPQPHQPANGNWLNIISLGVGILGIVLAYYWYAQGIAERKPTFIVDPIRIEILNSKRISAAPLSVYYRSRENKNVQVKNDLTAVRFYFWNSGKIPIKSEDILEPLNITFDDKNVSIINFQTLKVTRPITGWDLRQTGSAGLQVSFRILEEGDGATGQLIYEGNPTANLRISGILEGVKQIETNSSMARNSFWLGLYRSFSLWVSFFLGILFGPISKWLEKHFPRIFKVYSYVAGAFIVLIVLVYLGSCVQTKTHEIHQASQSAIHDSVPAPLRDIK